MVAIMIIIAMKMSKKATFLFFIVGKDENGIFFTKRIFLLHFRIKILLKSESLYLASFLPLFHAFSHPFHLSSLLLLLHYRRYLFSSFISLNTLFHLSSCIFPANSSLHPISARSILQSFLFFIPYFIFSSLCR